MVFDPGFENEGPLAGDADGWATSIVNSNWGYAAFGARHWGAELFETDWGVDNGLKLFFEPSDLDAAEFDPAAPVSYEDFLYWPTLVTLLTDWSQVTSDPALFDSGAVPEEDFVHSSWGVDPWYPAFVSYILGDATEPFTFTTTSNKLGIKLEGASTFDTTLTVPAATYATATSLASQLQTLVDAALTGAGAPFAAGDIKFMAPATAPTQIIVINDKSNYKMTIYSATSDDGWPVILGRDPNLMDFRWFEQDLLSAADHDWVGEYNSDTKDHEDFERDWFNSDTTIPWEYMFHLAEFIDATETIPPGNWVISVGVNDRISLRYRQWGTTNVTTTTNIIAPGTYTTAQLVTQIQGAIDSWLAAAGAPFSVGDIVCKESPNGTIRLENVGTSFDLVLFVTDDQTGLWDYIGMPYDDPNHVEEYLHSVTARWTPVTTLRFALFDPGNRQYEDFEAGW